MIKGSTYITAGAVMVLTMVVAVSTTLVAANAAASLHPWLGQGVMVLSIGAILWLLAPPIVKTMRVRTLPDIRELKTPPRDPDGVANVARLASALIREWAGCPGDPEDEKETRELLALASAGRPFIDPVCVAIARRRERCKELIRKRAATTAGLTVLSWRGPLDSAIVLIAQVRLMGEIVRCYGFRLPVTGMLKLYGFALASAVMAGQVEDMPVEDVFAEAAEDALGSVGARAAGFLGDAFIQAVFAAATTLLLGRLAMAGLDSGLREGRLPAKDLKVARREARREALSIVVHGLGTKMQQALGHFAGDPQSGPTSSQP